ncbi:MAG: GntR family transcriptional regulator [Verrucomicrobiota bacterium]
MKPKSQPRKVSRTSLREECRKRLMEMVIKGHFGEEERLNETKIAEDLGVSQTPVREALVALECQGFLTSYPNRGFVVVPFSRREGQDLYEAIAELEAIALRNAPWPNRKLLDEVEALNSEFKAAEDPEERVLLDVEWHDLLISQTRNQYLRELASLTKKRVFRYEWNFMTRSVEPSFQSHEEIITELRSGNVERAAEILKENHLSGIPVLDEWLSTRHANDD